MIWNPLDKEGTGQSGCRMRGCAMARLVSIVALLAVVVFCFGCSSRRPPPPQMKLFVESEQAMNNGQLFYLVVRAVTDKQFLTESYQTVAGLVFADPPDKTVISSHVVLPGINQEFQVIQPEESPVGFFFMLTEPGDQWKKLVEQPLAKEYVIRIHKDGIMVTPRKSTLKKILWPFGS